MGTAVVPAPASSVAPATQTATTAPASGGWAKLARDVFAGTCGGISVTLVGHPFDTIKVRLQTQSHANPMYSGMVDCAKKTIQMEGFAGLYKGVMSPLAGQMFFRASLFGAFGESKRWLGTNADGSARPLQWYDYYKAGGMTGFVAAFSEGPIDFYKSQVQVQVIRLKANPNYKAPYTTMLDCVRATLRESGIRGPYQGLSATIIRNTPANAVYLGNFEMMKQAYCRAYNCDQKNIPGHIVLGAAGLGGLTYWVVIFPVDSVKSAMQTDSIIRSERRFTTFLKTTQMLYAEGGIARFYKGFTPCIVRAMPANGVMLLTVEKVTSLLNSLSS